MKSAEDASCRRRHGEGKKVSFGGRERLCEWMSGAALRHAPPAPGRGAVLSGGGSRSQPVHSPAPDARFHGKKKEAKQKTVIKGSVPSRQLSLSTTRARLFLASHVRLRFSRSSSGGGSGASAVTAPRGRGAFSGWVGCLGMRWEEGGVIQRGTDKSKGGGGGGRRGGYSVLMDTSLSSPRYLKTPITHSSVSFSLSSPPAWLRPSGTEPGASLSRSNSGCDPAVTVPRHFGGSGAERGGLPASSASAAESSLPAGARLSARLH